MPVIVQKLPVMSHAERVGKMRGQRDGWMYLGETTAMMGTKERSFAPLVNVSLEDLVPADHFYRHLDRTLDLSFAPECVQETYAGGGRPSVDPVIFFKLQLMMFFESIRSERLLMRHVADWLSVRWYVGYGLNELLSDHSSLARIRARSGVEVFRRFFEAIVEQCQQAGLVWGRELYIDATNLLTDDLCRQHFSTLCGHLMRESPESHSEKRTSK